MILCKFNVPSEFLAEMDGILEQHGFDNVSIFENTELGFSDKLDENGFPIANFFDVEILVDNEEAAEHMKKIFTKQLNDKIRNFGYFLQKDEDWVNTYLSELKPVICDRFYFYNENIQHKSGNSSLIPIKLNSALAFGSGHHQTTQACLLNMCYLFEHENYKVKSILDMGCGTGILGICAQKLWKKTKLLGIDIDAEAVKITNDNYTANKVDATAIISDCPPKTTGGFNLIFCNILKQPLIDLCSEFVRVMSTGAYIITSGFITSQEQEITEAYTSNGFGNVNRIQSDDWLSIMFRKNDN